MDQETAKKLLVEGGTFVFLGVPQETQFGIDMQCWNTEEDFRGIKMIPPGLHYVHYSAVSKETGDISPRSGFMHYFDKKEFVVKMWDKKLEDISKDEISEESIQRLKDNLLNIDKHLAPYPYEIWQKWKQLSSQITAELAQKLSPLNGLIRASVDLLPMSDKDRPRGNKSKQSIEPDPVSKEVQSDDSTPGQSGAKRVRRITEEEKEQAMLPDLKPAPGEAMRFTEIPKEKYPPGSTPGEITKHYLDQTYSLDLMIAQHDEPLHIIGELQFTYLCFLIGHSLEAFEHWKNLVILLCSCDKAILKYRNVYFNFIKTIETQIDEMPGDFLADIVMNKNVIYKKLRYFFRTVFVNKKKIDGQLLSLIVRFIENLTQKLKWDFTGLNDYEEDEKPVLVLFDDFVAIDEHCILSL
ncbi:protein AAR2 homolog [Vanessa tameamea]|uniref:Protein AAR2 homolog n=1 Tax=Vanessa tameamea TaxID=334116 RepID=A0A8B8IIU0_VANTA|nr:protein AAR2 homolog [Vanessa tameamea]XP_047528628.1 protein AAR2 homolog isoform X1 [Vanessa atalanta]